MSERVVPSAELRLRVEELTGFHAGLVRAAGATGMTAAELHEFFSGKVRASCVGCGLALTGEDLGRIALAAPESAADPQADRLRLGYCGKATCQSRFYQVVVDPTPKAVPEKLVPQAVELWRNPPPEPEEAAAPKAPLPWWRERRNQYALGALLALLLAWWRFGPTEGPMALRKEPVKYETAPQPGRGNTGSGEALQ